MVLQVNIEPKAVPLIPIRDQSLAVDNNNHVTIRGSHLFLPTRPITIPTTTSTISMPEILDTSRRSIISNLSPIKRTPSTPTFKKSASVIYEEYEDDDDEEDTVDDDDNDQVTITAGPPPQYFELASVPVARKKKTFMREESIFDKSDIEHSSSEKSTMSDAADGLTSVLSALYAKLLVIIGLCFPMAEVISHRIPIGWYEGFYLYMYLGSILFLVITYACRKSKKGNNYQIITMVRAWICWSSDADDIKKSNKPRFTLSSTDSSIEDEPLSKAPSHFGSFYLRLGAVAFGIGSMIYSGLEFGQFFELESDKEHCYSFLYGFTPSAHMAFTFFQLYFVFMNSKEFISKHFIIARFGLMHMIATNLCVWLHVLIQETKHQITILVHPGGLLPNGSASKVQYDTGVNDYLDTFEDPAPEFPAMPSFVTTVLPSTLSHHIERRSIADHEMMTHGQCRRTNVIGQLVQDASQFLFPCTIEYSLICAAVLYMMWKHTEAGNGKSGTLQRSRHRSTTSTSTVNYHNQKYHYQVDCAKAHKGLFCGIFLLVVCIISLILFFVLLKKPHYKHLGVLQAHIVELLIYIINSIACVIAAFQIKKLRYSKHRNVELDNILLIVAQTGLYIFNMFSMIGAQFFGTAKNTQLVLINAIACILQATLQTTFILDASRRYCQTPEQSRRKPGREMVTFMLVCNFAMWAINTLETRRADSNPVQMHFYGFWAWTIITHVTTPLTIFYRFHSTVCLCDIWKRVYKIRSDFP